MNKLKNKKEPFTFLLDGILLWNALVGYKVENVCLFAFVVFLWLFLKHLLLLTWLCLIRACSFWDFSDIPVYILKQLHRASLLSALNLWFLSFLFTAKVRFSFQLPLTSMTALLCFACCSLDFKLVCFLLTTLPSQPNAHWPLMSLTKPQNQV